MKLILVLSVVFAVAFTAPAPAPAPAPAAAALDSAAHAQILRFQNDNSGNGYNFAYETSDGVSRQETGELKDAGSEQEAFSIRGSVSWVADDGQTYTLNYIADENGYQPQGEHIPRAS